MPKISEIFPKKYATGEDLTGKPVTLTIARLVQEQMHPQAGSPAVAKWVIYFERAGKGIVLSPTLARQVAALLGDETEAWQGKRINLYPEPMTVAGKARIAIRARAAPNGETPPPAAMTEDEEDL